MKINADFDTPAIAHAKTMDWISSPMQGVERKPLDRVGESYKQTLFENAHEKVYFINLMPNETFVVNDHKGLVACATKTFFHSSV